MNFDGHCVDFLQSNNAFVRPPFSCNFRIAAIWKAPRPYIRIVPQPGA